MNKLDIVKKRTGELENMLVKMSSEQSHRNLKQGKMQKIVCDIGWKCIYYDTIMQRK